MATQEQIEKIALFAAQAPSGDNAQPWRFEATSSAMDIYNIPGKDDSPYNYQERGSLFAHGAAIENAIIGASSLGIAITPSLFPEGGIVHIARLVFGPLVGSGDPLAQYIQARTTNRKPYNHVPLATEDRAAIVKVGERVDISLHLIEQREVIGNLAKILSTSDRLIFEDKAIHDAIFSSIRWTEEEENAEPGLYLKTLELPPPARVVFRLMKNWKMLTMLNRIRMSRFIAFQSAKNYAACSAIGVLVVSKENDVSFVEAGRCFERLWLTAASRGLSIQPVTALPYLATRVRAGAASGMSIEHQKEVQRADEGIKAAVGNPGGSIAMVFRIGYGNPPTARSRKVAPEINFTK